MIKVIYGPKGTGKTKIIIDEANGKVASAKGHMIFITNTKRYMYDLHRDIRLIDTTDYDIAGEEALIGFIKGAVAANNDNEYLFVDGAARIAGKDIKDMAAFYYMLDKLSETNGLTIYVTVSSSKEDLPDFVKNTSDTPRLRFAHALPRCGGGRVFAARFERAIQEDL